MYLTPTDTVQTPHKPFQQAHLPSVHNDTKIMASIKSLYITGMIITTQHISNNHQAKFYNDGFSIGIHNLCSITVYHIKKNLWDLLRRDNVLSIDLRVPRCTRFMTAPLPVPFAIIKDILSKLKYPTIYMFPTGMSGSSVPNIGHRMQHQKMYILPPCMAPGMSLTVIALP